jgi:hypothetical protein
MREAAISVSDFMASLHVDSLKGKAEGRGPL